MRIFDINDAKAQLSTLVDHAAHGDGFVIAVDGNPQVNVVAVDAPAAREMKRIGFLLGEFSVPDDFNSIGSAEIERLFSAEPASTKA